MLFVRKPSLATIHEFLRSQSKLEFSYRNVGATAEVHPTNTKVDHTRIKLGQGAEVFERAKASLRRWDQFRLGWVEASPTDTPIEVGVVVAVVAKQVGLWWLNACRIVYVVDDVGPDNRFGFAYGTLPDHCGKGEERFLVEWDRAGGDVFYDILAFSQPNHFLTRLGYPYMRRVQKRFGRASSAAMLRAVGASEQKCSAREGF